VDKAAVISYYPTHTSSIFTAPYILAKMNRLVLILVVFTCLMRGISMAHGQGATSPMTHMEYISRYSPIAISNMREFGIPASITLAQGILESGAGNSDLARNANNHFGIKCHTGWQGKTYHKDDDAKNECFRAYNTPEESFDDHARFLTTRSRYSALFELDITDYKGWAHGLRAAGYATNPAYAERLINLIERHELHRYDQPGGGNQVAGRSTDERHVKTREHKSTVRPPESRQRPEIGHPMPVLTNNRVKYVVAQPGQTLRLLADELQIRPWMLRKYNDLDRDGEIQPGDKVYVQSKRRKGSQAEHICQPGDSLHGISQKYGIKMHNLLRNNNLQPDSAITPGMRLRLR
jgi:LysM repeat protein